MQSVYLSRCSQGQSIGLATRVQLPLITTHYTRDIKKNVWHKRVATTLLVAKVTCWLGKLTFQNHSKFLLTLCGYSALFKRMRLLFKNFWDVLYMYLDVGWMEWGHTLSKTTSRYSECATDHTADHRVAEHLMSEGLGNIS